MITIENLSKSYQSGKTEHTVLDKLNLTIEKGEFLSIIGTSGSGKTTLLNLIGGLDSKHSGQITIGGVNLKSLNDKKLSAFRNNHIGFVFQSFHLIPHLTCLENVMLPSYFGGQAKVENPLERAKTVLKEVGLESKINEKPAEMSGGQKQRVAIARALFNHPEIILCDEPTGSLDRTTGIQVLELFKKLNKQHNITFLMVTHEEHISKSGKRIIRLEEGKIIYDNQVANGHLDNIKTDGAMSSKEPILIAKPA